MTTHRKGHRLAYALLLIPVIFCLWVPFYNRVEPTVLGVPFFYWYQLLWVILTAVVTAIVYRLTD